MTVYVSNCGDDGNGGLEKDGAVATVAAALEKIRGAQKGAARIVIMDAVATDPIVIDRSCPPVILSDDPDAPGGKLTLRRDGNLLTVSEGGDVTLAGGLTLAGLTPTGLSPAESLALAESLAPAESGSKESRGVYIKGGTFTMRGGIISGNITTSDDGAEMLGGGGVYMDKGTFTLRGGAISGNIATYGCGVYVTEGEFTMEGGNISGNTAAVCPGADMTGGGGVFLAGGEFTLMGGAISGNRAAFGGGVGLVGGKFTMTGGIISGNHAIFGGGVETYGVFIKRGGVIYGEQAGELANTADGCGAAVYDDMETAEVFTDETLGEADDWPT
jgi:hypothetical protein